MYVYIYICFYVYVSMPIYTYIYRYIWQHVGIFASASSSRPLANASLASRSSGEQLRFGACIATLTAVLQRCSESNLPAQQRHLPHCAQ